MDFNLALELVLEITVLIVIGIELLSLYWFSRFYRKINENFCEVVQSHLEKSDELTKILQEHVDKLDKHVNKLDEYLITINKHVLTLEEMMRKVTKDQI